MEDNQDDLIADYLMGNLDPSAKQAFEQQLAANPALAARVALEQELAEALGSSSPENQLRANLQRIGNKIKSPESLEALAEQKPKRKLRWGWMLTVTLLAGFSWFWWNANPLEKQPLPPPTPSAPEPSALQSPEDSTKTMVPETTPDPEKPRHIAAAFNTLPPLEAYIGSKLRSGGIHMRVEHPKSSEVLHISGGKVHFRFSGKTEGKIPEGQLFRWLILDNKLQNFESMRAVETQALSLKSGSEFLIEKQLSLPPGLYYLLVEEKDAGEWVFVDKFLVK